LWRDNTETMKRNRKGGEWRGGKGERGGQKGDNGVVCSKKIPRKTKRGGPCNGKERHNPPGFFRENSQSQTCGKGRKRRGPLRAMKFKRDGMQSTVVSVSYV